MSYHTPLDPTEEMFDNKTLEYDLSKFPLPAIVLKTIQKFYPAVISLDTIHEIVPSGDIQQLMSNTTQELLKGEFYDYYDKMVQENVVPKLGKDVLIQKFGNLRILVPDQDKIGAVLLYHQGRWVGNGLGLRTIWMPFTDCFESNTMQIMDLDISRDVTRESVRDKWSYEKLNDYCVENSWPITLKPGQAHMFFQEHIHGNIPNRTNKTRVSIDIRLLIKDGQPHRKWPGAYFRKLFDKKYNQVVEILPHENVVTYGEYEGIKTKHIDLHFQTLVVKNYCKTRNYKYPYQHGENEGLHYAHMEYLISKAGVDHLMLFSIFSLPDDPIHRTAIMKSALASKCRLHFCNEELVLENEQDLEKIEYLRSFTNDWSSPVDSLNNELGI
jgi:sporadic carbohydrate cluster 2OG-Fe(II) oxygenase/sporadic carbohydrate cluster protein (TIGR04323 family)